MNYKWVTVCPDWVIFKKFLVTNFLAKEAQISNDFLVLGSYNHGPPYLLIFINMFQLRSSMQKKTKIFCMQKQGRQVNFGA